MGPFSDWIEALFGKLWDIRNLIGNDVVGVIIAVIVYVIAAILMFLIFVAVPAVGVILKILHCGAFINRPHVILTLIMRWLILFLVGDAQPYK